MSRGALSVRRAAARKAVIGIAVASSALGVLAGAATAAVAPHKQLTLLQQGLNYYKGKTITLISPDAVGGGFDLTARAVAPYIAQYLGATVNVENDSPANTIAGQDLMEASTPNGLTIGMLNAGADIEDIVTGQPGVNFNPQKVQFLGGNNPNSGTGFTCSTSSNINNFGEVVNNKRQITETVVSTGTQTLQLDLVNAAFGINAKEIGGYTSTSLEVAGFERGDGVCGPFGIATGSFAPYMSAGHASLLLDLFTPNPATAFYSLTKSAVTLTQAEAKYPAKTKLEKLARTALLQVAGTGLGHQFNAPARTPAAEVAALRAAVQSALTNIQCEDKLLSEGQQNGYVSGTRALGYYKAEYAALKPVSSLIKNALGV